MKLDFIINERQSQFRAMASDATKQMFYNFKDFLKTSKHWKRYNMYTELHGEELLITVRFEKVKGSKMPKNKPWVFHASAGWNDMIDMDTIEIEFSIDPDYYTKENFNPTLGEFHDVMRHEFEHIAQGLGKREGIRLMGSSEDTKYADYLTLKSEIPAFVAGFYRRAQYEKRPIDDIMREFLEERKDKLSSKEMEKVMDIWIKQSKKNYPRAIYSK